MAVLLFMQTLGSIKSIIDRYKYQIASESLKGTCKDDTILERKN